MIQSENQSHKAKGVEMRISDKGIEQCIKDAPFYTPMIVKMALDLQDARARIRELEALSASQDEAHALRDRGVKL